ncbi:MAG: acyl-CoA thioesterase [Kordiimonas sp.]
MAVFETMQKIGFQHCDPAGIVFYPRYFEMFNAAIEEWFEKRVGISFHDIHMVRGEVVPTVHVEVDFKAPSRLGETIILALSLVKIGNSSITFNIDVKEGAAIRVQAELVLVYAKSALEQSDGWPGDLRAALTKQLIQN